MREIKFRAWDNVEWKMYYNHSVCLTIDGEVSFLSTSGEWEKDDDKSMITLMQYTGLKDKNGVEVFEGDLMRLDDNYFLGEVGFQHGQFVFTNLGASTTLAYKIKEGYVVVGNIYSNQELLNPPN